MRRKPSDGPATTLAGVLREVRSCAVCAAHCPLGCKPLVSIGPKARILIIGQAPGQRAHTSGIPWNDPSGQRLRSWMGVNDSMFYNPDLIALMPMGFCYPGTGSSGDHPPRPECAPLWHDRLLAFLPHVTLTLLIGQYALDRYASELPGATLTERLQQFSLIAPARFPLVHPSPRNELWLKRNPWFATTLLPQLKAAVRSALD